MQLIAWRTTGKNPCDDPPVHISIASKEPGTDVWPWIIPLARAVEMFTQEVVDQIPEAPEWVPVRLEMKWEFATVKAPESSEPHRSSGT
jgi:hypothetical protein